MEPSLPHGLGMPWSLIRLAPPFLVLHKFSRCWRRHGGVEGGRDSHAARPRSVAGLDLKYSPNGNTLLIAGLGCPSAPSAHGPHGARRDDERTCQCRSGSMGPSDFDGPSVHSGCFLGVLSAPFCGVCVWDYLSGVSICFLEAAFWEHLFQGVVPLSAYSMSVCCTSQQLVRFWRKPLRFRNTIACIFPVLRLAASGSGFGGGVSVMRGHRRQEARGVVLGPPHVELAPVASASPRKSTPT